MDHGDGSLPPSEPERLYKRHLQRSNTKNNPLFEGNLQYAFSCILPVFFKYVDHVRNDLVSAICEDYRERNIQRRQQKGPPGKRGGLIHRLSSRKFTHRSLQYARVLDRNESTPEIYFDGSPFRAEQDDMREALYTVIQDLSCSIYDGICRVQDSLDGDVARTDVLAREVSDRENRRTIADLEEKLEASEKEVIRLRSQVTRSKRLVDAIRNTLFKEVVQLREQVYRYKTGQPMLPSDVDPDVSGTDEYSGTKKSAGASGQHGSEPRAAVLEESRFTIFDWMTILSQEVPLDETQKEDLLIKLGNSFREEIHRLEVEHDHKLQYYRNIVQKGMSVDTSAVQRERDARLMQSANKQPHNRRPLMMDRGMLTDPPAATVDVDVQVDILDPPTTSKRSTPSRHSQRTRRHRRPGKTDDSGTEEEYRASEIESDEGPPSNNSAIDEATRERRRKRKEENERRRKAREEERERRREKKKLTKKPSYMNSSEELDVDTASRTNSESEISESESTNSDDHRRRHHHHRPPQKLADTDNLVDDSSVDIKEKESADVLDELLDEQENHLQWADDHVEAIADSLNELKERSADIYNTKRTAYVRMLYYEKLREQGKAAGDGTDRPDGDIDGENGTGFGLSHEGSLSSSEISDASVQRRSRKKRGGVKERVADSGISTDDDAENTDDDNVETVEGSNGEMCVVRRVPMPAPLGMVTMVFTDVQNSTRQWDSFPVAMISALNEHFSVLRHCMREMHGYEVKTEGDGVFAVFSDPLEAARFCLRAQVGLMNAEWAPEVIEANKQLPEDGPEDQVLYRGLRVRMGFHCGEPICTPDVHSGRMDYFGPPVNRAARVGGAGYGGQILISGECWEILEPRSAELSSLDPFEHMDHGTHEFKGLRDPVHVHSIVPYELRGRVFGEVRTGKPAVPQQMEVVKHVLDSHNELAEEKTSQLMSTLQSLEGDKKGADKKDKLAHVVKKARTRNKIKQWSQRALNVKKRNSQRSGEIKTLGKQSTKSGGGSKSSVHGRGTSSADVGILKPIGEANEQELRAAMDLLTGGSKGSREQRRASINSLALQDKEYDILISRVRSEYAAQLTEAETRVKSLTDSLETLSTKHDELAARDQALLKRIDYYENAKKAAAAEEETRARMISALEAKNAEGASQIPVSQPAPTGLVALVFTDVENSTRQWDANPDLMVDALNEHFRVIRKCLTDNDGYEVKTEGDGVFAVFQTAVQAARFCLQAQEGLMQAKWPQEVIDTNRQRDSDGPGDVLLYNGLRVRMGFHCGSPICKVDALSGRMDYFGPVVNRAARVGGAAYGGQILISDESWNMIREHLDDLGSPQPVHLDRGTHEFKGLREPEHVHQILPFSIHKREFGEVRVEKAAISQSGEYLKHVLENHQTVLAEREQDTVGIINSIEERIDVEHVLKAPPANEKAGLNGMSKFVEAVREVRHDLSRLVSQYENALHKGRGSLDRKRVLQHRTNIDRIVMNLMSIFMENVGNHVKTNLKKDGIDIDQVVPDLFAPGKPPGRNVGCDPILPSLILCHPISMKINIWPEELSHPSLSGRLFHMIDHRSPRSSRLAPIASTSNLSHSGVIDVQRASKDDLLINFRQNDRQAPIPPLLRPPSFASNLNSQTVIRPGVTTPIQSNNDDPFVARNIGASRRAAVRTKSGRQDDVVAPDQLSSEVGFSLRSTGPSAVGPLGAGAGFNAMNTSALAASGSGHVDFGDSTMLVGRINRSGLMNVADPFGKPMIRVGGGKSTSNTDAQSVGLMSPGSPIPGGGPSGSASRTSTQNTRNPSPVRNAVSLGIQGSVPKSQKQQLKPISPNGLSSSSASNSSMDDSNGMPSQSGSFDGGLPSANANRRTSLSNSADGGGIRGGTPSQGMDSRQSPGLELNISVTKSQRGGGSAQLGLGSPSIQTAVRRDADDSSGSISNLANKRAHSVMSKRFDQKEAAALDTALDFRRPSSRSETPPPLQPPRLGSPGEIGRTRSTSPNRRERYSEGKKSEVSYSGASGRVTVDPKTLVALGQDQVGGGSRRRNDLDSLSAGLRVLRERVLESGTPIDNFQSTNKP